MLMTGVCQRDITPPPGVRLAGYPHFTRENTGAHDPLTATAVSLSDGETAIVFLAADLLFVSKKYVAELRARLRKRPGAECVQLAVSCSHTQSGPWAAGNPELDAIVGEDGYIDPDYLAHLLDVLEETAAEALRSSFEGEVGFSSVRCGAESGVGGNRRDPKGVTDPWVNVAAVRDKAGAVRGILCNYALHPTFLHEDSLLVSSDYPHFLRETLEKRYPGAVVGFAQGASGDQSSRYFRRGQSFDEARRVGTVMGDAADRAIRDMTFTGSPVLSCASREIPLAIRSYPPVSELKEAVRLRSEEYDALVRAGAPYLDVQNANLRLLGAEDMLGYALVVESGQRLDMRDDEDPCEVSVYRVGDSVIVGLPGEHFVEYGLRIRANPRAAYTFVFCVTNGCLPGYCITDDAYEGSGYETGNCMLERGFGDRIVSAALELIDEVFA